MDLQLVRGLIYTSLLLIMTLCSNCGERRISSTIKKSQNIMNMIYNVGHNIFELYNVLVQIQLTTSKPKYDIWCSKLGTQVVLRVSPLGIRVVSNDLGF